MKRFFLVLGIFSVIILWTQVFLGATELTLSIPPGWTPVTSQNPGEKLRAFLLDEQGTARAELVLSTEPVTSDLDLQGYLQQVIQFLQGIFQSYTPQETTPFAVHGLSGLRHRFLFRVRQIPTNCRVWLFCFSMKTRPISFSLTAWPPIFPSWKTSSSRSLRVLPWSIVLPPPPLTLLPRLP